MPQPFWRNTIMALSALVIAIVVIHPVAEVGMNDDWSYVRTAFDLASTGHLQYNGWAAPIIGFQAYWGALFLRIFGSSFTIARLSTVLLMLLFIPLLLRLNRLAGLAPGTALFATLALVLSPLLLISATSFMTDTPAFLLFAGSLLCALEAWKSSKRSYALRWMLAAFLLGALSGSVRQVYWAGPLWFLLVLAVVRFKTTLERAVTAACFLALLIFSVAVSRWQDHQPYVGYGPSSATLTTVAWNEALYSGFRYLLRFLIDWGVLLLPVTAAFLLLAQRLRPRWIWLPLFVLAGLLVFWVADPTPWTGNTLTEYGSLSPGLVIPGDKPLLLNPAAVLIIATAGLLILAAAVILAAQSIRSLSLEALRFAALTLPFLCVYVGAITIRGPVYGIYDRYSIPVIAILSILLLSVLRARPIPNFCWVLLSIYCLYGIAVAHDNFAEARARIDAINKLLLSGVKRTQLLGGFEFDCWTQVDQNGYVNNEVIKIPPNAYHKAGDCSGDDNLQFWWRDLVPSIQASYVLTMTPLPELERPILFRATYRTWLPFATRTAYVQRSATLLTCQPDSDSDKGN